MADPGRRRGRRSRRQVFGECTRGAGQLRLPGIDRTGHDFGDGAADIVRVGRCQWNREMQTAAAGALNRSRQPDFCERLAQRERDPRKRLDGAAVDRIEIEA